MLKDITIGQYFPIDSFIHKLDPRNKLITTFLFIILIFFVNSAIGFALTAVFILAIIFAAKLPFKYVIKGLKPVFFIILFTAVLNIFFTKGQTLIFHAGIIKIYLEGVNLALLMAARLIALITVTNVLTLTTSPIDLTAGLEILLNPLKKIKVPAHEIAMMMTIALRFIPTLIDETDKIMKAQMARGAEIDTGSLINKIKAFIPILIPLFISAFRRADELAMAMECRCYNGGDGRTKMKKLKTTSKDYISMVTFVVFAVCTISIKFFNLP